MRLEPTVFLVCFSVVIFVITLWLKRRRRKNRQAVARRVASQLKNLVGMTSREEREFVRQYAADEFKGKGAIVDLGCWLGSFTLPLAIGLRENPHFSRASRIHAYDLFRWQDWMNGCVAGTALAGRYKEGDDFADAFREQVAPVSDLVAIHPGDLNRERWDRTAPIEYLLVDAMKSWELTNSVLRIFFPALRPGLSLVHHQDFAHYYTPWIHLIMYRFRRYFEPLTYVPAGSYIFAYREQIPSALLAKTYDFTDFSSEEAIDAFAYSLDLLPTAARANVLAARIMMFIHRRDWSGARADLERVRAAGTPMSRELAVVAELLDNHVG